MEACTSLRLSCGLTRLKLEHRLALDNAVDAASVADVDDDGDENVEDDLMPSIFDG